MGGHCRRWFKPEARGSAFKFQISREQFPTDDASPPLTVQSLLDAAAISTDEVESWHVEGDAAAGNSLDVGHLLPPPPAMRIISRSMCV